MAAVRAWVAAWTEWNYLVGHYLIQLGFDRRQVTVDQFVQQLSLNRVELLAATGVFLVLKDSHFVGQPLDDGIAAHQLSLLAAQGLILDVQRVHQFRRQGAELIGRELVDIGTLSHAA